MNLQKTLAIIKPDIVEKKSIGKVIDFWEKNKLRIVGLKMWKFTEEQAKHFYKEHENKEFFKSLVNFICRGPVVVICLEGQEAIKINREIIGFTDPSSSKDGTIRKEFGESIEVNAVHGSGSLSDAEREIKIFFKEEELFL